MTQMVQVQNLAMHGHCVVFLNKTLYSHSACTHTQVEMGSGTSDLMLAEVVDGQASHLGRVEITVFRQSTLLRPGWAPTGHPWDTWPDADLLFMY